MPVIPQPAVVAPRILSPTGGVETLLSDAVLEWLETDSRVFAIQGEPGSGKSTALADLASRLVGGDVEFLDEPQATHLAEVTTRSIITVSHPEPRIAHDGGVIRSLAKWNRDSVLEWLMSERRDVCGSVMQRLRASNDAEWPEGNPRVWTLALRRMADDPDATDVRGTVRDWLATHATEDDLDEALIRLQSHRGRAVQLLADWNRDLAPELHAAPLLRMLFSIVVARDLHEGRPPVAKLTFKPYEGLLREIAMELQDRPGACAAISKDPVRDSALQPVLHSVMHRVMRAWRPPPQACGSLVGASLPGIDWRDMELCAVDAAEIDLSSATLDRCDWSKADLRRASLHGAHLRLAKLRQAQLDAARFDAADLRSADLHSASAVTASFRGANCEGAKFVAANLQLADMSGAACVRTRFWKANLVGTKFEGTDLSDARFDLANLRRARFADCRLDRASFRRAHAKHAVFRDLEANDLTFSDAHLARADLTGSKLNRANFRRAYLQLALLADITWEGAILRDADLRGARFHTGSSRSGLVGSTVAGEGSRTGFYTEELEEQHFRAPEEIRKANLRGADLRGAHVWDTNFYLVDLRDAQYDANQRDHFRRSGAIL